MKEAADFHPSHTKRRNRLVLVCLIVLVAVGGAGYWYWQNTLQAQAEDAPLLATVERGSIENTIASAGTLKPSRYVDVGAQVSGQLQRLHAQVGDVVEQGQLLAEIDARVQAAKVEASRASIAAQEAQLDARRAALALAKANAARQERLMRKDATSQLEYDTSINNLASPDSSLIQLQRQIEQSKATLESDETQLGFTKIFAPSDGTVVSISMLEGVMLNANQTAPIILRIADLSTMTVEAGISEADIGSVKKDMDVYFTTLGSGTRRWYSTVRQVLPTPVVTNNVVLYTGLFDAQNPDGALFSEMTAQVYFVTSAARDVLVVPLGSLTFVAPEIGAAARPGAAPSMSPPASNAATGAGAGGGNAFAGSSSGSAMLARPAGRGAAGEARPRPAMVTVVRPDGSREDRQVLIGVTSRVSAEVISGLQEGEQVIAGIVQAAPTAGSPQQNNFPGGFQGGGVRIGR